MSYAPDDAGGSPEMGTNNIGLVLLQNMTTINFNVQYFRYVTYETKIQRKTGITEVLTKMSFLHIQNAYYCLHNTSTFCLHHCKID